MVVYLTSYFSPNMLSKYKQVKVNLTKLSTPEFIQEVRKAFGQNQLVPSVMYGDTVDLVRKITGVSIRPKKVDILLSPEDELLLVVIKRRSRFEDVWEAFKLGAVFFWKAKLEEVQYE